jgi:hypothetical protein
MKAVVFVGPTLAVEEAQLHLDALYLPPVAQGDVYRIALERPDAIGIIDGYFDRVPAVWHKEILWAMREGIPVFGSASMGALRAAELATFGMHGVGLIFEDYLSGTLEDDDEVVLIHAPTEFGYQPLSEPMVNIRATLARAVEQDVITREEVERLISHLKKLHYPQRSYSTLLKLAEQDGMPAERVEQLRRWLSTGRVDRKREDAVSMLQTMRQWLESDGRPKDVDYVFERTTLWDELTRLAGKVRLRENQAEALMTETLESALPVESLGRLRRDAMLRILVLDEAQRHGLEVDEEHIRQAILRFRQDRGLLEPQQLERWLEENDLTLREFILLMDQEVRSTWVESLLETKISAALPDQLRLRDMYAALLKADDPAPTGTIRR